MDVEVDVVDGVDAPEAPADAAEADDRLGALRLCCYGCHGSFRLA
jgi:hypothetical protein